MLAAFSLLPILLFLVYGIIMMAVLIFVIVMITRFVKAHERIAKQLETLVSQQSGDRKPDLPS